MPIGPINPDGNTPTARKTPALKKLEEALKLLGINRGNTVGGSFGKPTGFPFVRPEQGPTGFPFVRPEQKTAHFPFTNRKENVPWSIAAPGTKPTSGPEGRPSPQPAQNPSPMDFTAGGGMGGMGGDMFGGAGSIEGMIQSILGDVDLPDAGKMAAEQFDPQFDLLGQLRSQTTGRMNKQAQDSRAMYDALAQSINQDKSGVAKEYDATAQSLDAAFGEAGTSIAETGQESGAQMRAMMKRLGISEAEPGAIAQIDESSARSANAIAEMQANYSGANTANKQNMLDYLTNEANTAGVAGANASADVKLALQNALQGYDNQELDLKGKEQAAKNAYLMQIAEMQQGAQQSAAKTAQDFMAQQLDQQRWDQEQAFNREKFAWGQQTDTWDNEMDRAAAERALVELQNGRLNGSKAASRDASTQLLEAAGGLYDDPQKANAVAYQIRSSLAADPEIESIARLLALVRDRFPGNPDATKYSHLASLYGQALGLK